MKGTMEDPTNIKPLKYLNEIKLAELLCISVKKLRADRWRGVGLPYVKFGSSVRYRVDQVEQFLEEHTITPGFHTGRT